MYAKLIDVMGDDLKICNAARASFGAKSDWDKVDCGHEDCGPECSGSYKRLAAKDANLIRYLARGCPAKEMEEIVTSLANADPDDFGRERILATLNDYRGKATHWVPFAHCQLTFEVHMPIFVARQLIRHTVGVSISEMSRRYVDENPEYYMPAKEGWRLAAANVKQGSSSDCLTGDAAEEVALHVESLCNNSTELYRRLVDVYKVAPELARIILPQNTYTDWTWTVSLVTVSRICHQRLDSHAQKEIRDLAQQIHDQTLEKFPVSFKALMSYGAE